MLAWQLTDIERSNQRTVTLEKHSKYNWCGHTIIKREPNLQFICVYGLLSYLLVQQDKAKQGSWHWPLKTNKQTKRERKKHINIILGFHHVSPGNRSSLIAKSPSVLFWEFFFTGFLIPKLGHRHFTGVQLLGVPPSVNDQGVKIGITKTHLVFTILKHNNVQYCRQHLQVEIRKKQNKTKVYDQ